MDVVPVMSLLGLIRVELERGRDVIVTITPTPDGKLGRLKLPDGWEEFMFAASKKQSD